MKLQIELDPSLDDDVIIIRCKQYNQTVSDLNQLLLQSPTKPRYLETWKREKRFYLDVNDILFFETTGDAVYAHTRDDNYLIKMRLYEIESLSLAPFLRISKSTIANINEIFSIEKSLGAGSLITFKHSHKEVYVSRSYSSALNDRLKERTQYEKK